MQYSKAIRRLSEVLNIFLMFEIFLLSSWDIHVRHSQFGIQNQILVSHVYCPGYCKFQTLSEVTDVVSMMALVH